MATLEVVGTRHGYLGESKTHTTRVSKHQGNRVSGLSATVWVFLRERTLCVTDYLLVGFEHQNWGKCRP